MDYVDVQGMRVPRIGLGTWQLTGMGCQQVVERAIELGYRHIDTAQAYENEAKVGAGIEAAVKRGVCEREDLFVTTKLSMDHLGREAVVRTAHESRRRLALDAIDLLLIHWPSEKVPLRETLEAMVRLQEEGSVRNIGVSNFPPSLLEEALTMAPIACVQVEYHPFLGQRELLRLCQRHDLMLTAYSPLARGEVDEDETLRAIAEGHGKTPAQVVLRWLIQQPGVGAIPKASSEEHLRDNLAIFDFELGQEEMRRVRELERGERLIDPEWAPRWEP